MIPWFQSLLSNTECCAMRPPADGRLANQFPSAPGAPRNGPRLYEPLGKPKLSPELVSIGLPDKFFFQIADHCVNDPSVARKIEHDRTCPLIWALFWGEARSPRLQFLQMCVRNRSDLARDIWTRLRASERRVFAMVAKYGAPSHDFFLNVMADDELLGKDCSDDESTASTSYTQWSSNSSSSGAETEDLSHNLIAARARC